MRCSGASFSGFCATVWEHPSCRVHARQSFQPPSPDVAMCASRQCSNNSGIEITFCRGGHVTSISEVQQTARYIKGRGGNGMMLWVSSRASFPAICISTVCCCIGWQQWGSRFGWSSHTLCVPLSQSPTSWSMPRQHQSRGTC